MRRTVLLLTSIALAAVLACGTAIAAAPTGARVAPGEGTGQVAGGQDAAAAGGRLSDKKIREVNAFIAQQMDQQNLPSVAVGIWIPGEGRYLAARGKANLRTGQRRTIAQPFRIASITKTFTATAVLQLVDEGKLKTTDKLSKWYPDFPNAHRITVDDLLRMSSGIPDPYDEEFMKNYYAHPRMKVSAEELIELSARKADQFKPPGKETVYTNINYVLLQRIVSKVSGEPLRVQIQKGILDPLDMDDSSYPTNDFLPGPLHGYSLNADTGKLEDKTVLNPAVPGGSGAMISTFKDLNTYTRALCGGGLLDPKTQATRLEGEQLGRGAEWARYGQGVLRLGEWCGHNGTIFGFSSEAFYLPAERAVIVVDVNRLDLDDQSKSSNFFFGISKILFPDHVEW